MKRCKDCQRQYACEIDEIRGCAFKKVCKHNDKRMYKRVW